MSKIRSKALSLGLAAALFAMTAAPALAGESRYLKKGERMYFEAAEQWGCARPDYEQTPLESSGKYTSYFKINREYRFKIPIDKYLEWNREQGNINDGMYWAFKSMASVLTDMGKDHLAKEAEFPDLNTLDPKAQKKQVKQRKKGLKKMYNGQRPLLREYTKQLEEAAGIRRQRKERKRKQYEQTAEGTSQMPEGGWFVAHPGDDGLGCCVLDVETTDEPFSEDQTYYNGDKRVIPVVCEFGVNKTYIDGANRLLDFKLGEGKGKKWIYFGGGVLLGAGLCALIGPDGVRVIIKHAPGIGGGGT